MTATIRLESSTDVIDLDEQWGSGLGYQAHEGASGLGLPDADVQWFEGAGSGSVYRGRRVQGREIDLPISILTDTAEDLAARLDRLTTLLSTPFRLVRVTEDGFRWVLEVVHAGGADYATGIDTDGETSWYATLQLRSGWPTWRRDEPEYLALSPAPEGAELPYGAIKLNNTGAADAWPVFTVQGPGTNFDVRDEGGYGFRWTGTLAAGETLTVDTEDGKVFDGTGANRYGLLASAPRMMPLKPGLNSWTVTMDGKAVGPGGSVLQNASATPTRTNWFPNPVNLATVGTATWIRQNLCTNPAARSTTGWTWRPGNNCVAELQNLTAGFGDTPTTPEWGTSGTYNRAIITKASYQGAKFSLFAPVVARGSGVLRLTGWARAKGSMQKFRPVARFTNTTDITTLAGPDMFGSIIATRRDWVQVSIELSNVTPGAYVWFGVAGEGALVNASLDLTEVLYERATGTRPYFDGSIGSTAAFPGSTRSWTGTAHASTSQITGPEAVGWTTTGTRCWMNGGSLYAYSSGRVVGPTVPHASGIPWVGSIHPTAIAEPSTVRFGIENVAGAPAARSAVQEITTTGARLTASGGGDLVTGSTVRPVLDIYGGGVVRFDHLLMERSTNLGGYFDGDQADSINGMYEWAGTAGASVSHTFPAKWVRASLSTVSYQPRRWAVI